MHFVFWCNFYIKFCVDKRYLDFFYIGFERKYVINVLLYSINNNKQNTSIFMHIFRQFQNIFVYKMNIG